MQMEDSDAEEEEDGGMDREKIANQLFDGDDVSLKNYNVWGGKKAFCHKQKQNNNLFLFTKFWLFVFSYWDVILKCISFNFLPINFSIVFLSMFTSYIRHIFIFIFWKQSPNIHERTYIHTPQIEKKKHI